MKKTRLLHLLALLLTAATGAWAQEPATTYSVKMKDGTQDAKNWTITSGEKSATGDAADGLTGLSEKDAVTLTYNGRMKVKGVKATSDAAPAEPSVPDGAINGKFSVSDGKQVYFAKGNLQAVCTSADNNPSDPETFTWQFAENQWDCVGNNAANNSIDGNGSVSAAGTVDLFGWSTAATTYGIHNSTTASDYSGDFVDWGETIGTGWRTLTKDEWNYLFMTRKSGSKVNGMSPSPDNARYTHATINTDNGTGGIRGMILFPDGVTVNYSDATYWGGINKYSNWNGSTKCTTSQWNALAAKGFVFLPTGGVRNGTTISNSNNNGYYWSSYTASPTSGYAHYTRVVASTEPTTASDSRKIGISVRLVYEVATTDAPATGNSVDLSTLTADYEAQNGDVLTGTLAGNYKISIADGATVTLDGVTINGGDDYSYKWAGLNCAGDATITLEGTNMVKGFYNEYPGIYVPSGKTLTIQGTGSLNARSNGYAAGIGGGYKIACGNITISGGTVEATGGDLAAGIGGGNSASCGNITINGGTITATGGKHGPGIGGGNSASCGNITIANTVTKVTATKGAETPHSIGKGTNGTCGTVTIGGTKYWENNAAVGNGATYLAQATIVYPAPTATVVDLSTISGDTYTVTGDVILTGTPTESEFYIKYGGDDYEITLDNVNSTGSKQVLVDGDRHNINIKLKGTSRLKEIYTGDMNNKTLTIGEAAAGGTLILTGSTEPIRAKSFTINGGTVKSQATGDNWAVYLNNSVGVLTINGGALYLAAGDDETKAVKGTVSGTLYGWNGSAWVTYTNQRYATTDNTSGNPTGWTW